jgi:hypothetical protein
MRIDQACMLIILQIYVDKIYQDGPCGDPASATAVKLTELNTCVKLTDDSEEVEYEYLFKDPS